MSCYLSLSLFLAKNKITFVVSTIRGLSFSEAAMSRNKHLKLFKNISYPKLWHIYTCTYTYWLSCTLYLVADVWPVEAGAAPARGYAIIVIFGVNNFAYFAFDESGTANINVLYIKYEYWICCNLHFSAVILPKFDAYDNYKQKCHGSFQTNYISLPLRLSSYHSSSE